MTDQNPNDIANELRQAEQMESALTRLFSSLQPPHGAADRLLAKLEGTFHESELTLDDSGPYSFQEAAAMAEFDAKASDLLAAGLEEEPVDEDALDDEED